MHGLDRPQDGIAIEQGLACDFRVPPETKWDQRTRGSAAAPAIAIDRMLPADFERPPASWTEISTCGGNATLDTDTAARLTIELRGPGTLWLDNASLFARVNASRVAGELTSSRPSKAMRPGIIRFGGSTLDDPNLGEFEWRWTRSATPTTAGPFGAWGGLQPTGPGLEEIRASSAAWSTPSP